MISESKFIFMAQPFVFVGVWKQQHSTTGCATQLGCKDQCFMQHLLQGGFKAAALFVLSGNLVSTFFILWRGRFHCSLQLVLRTASPISI